MAITFSWDDEKNDKLYKERGVSFEIVVSYLENGEVLAIVPGKGKYVHQQQFIIVMWGYAYIVPFVEKGSEIFLKTIIPSRKLTKIYLSKRGLEP